MKEEKTKAEELLERIENLSQEERIEVFAEALHRLQCQERCLRMGDPLPGFETWAEPLRQQVAMR